MSIIITGDKSLTRICIGHAFVVNKDNIDHNPSFIKKESNKKGV